MTTFAELVVDSTYGPMAPAAAANAINRATVSSHKPLSWSVVNRWAARRAISVKLKKIYDFVDVPPATTITTEQIQSVAIGMWLIIQGGRDSYFDPRDSDFTLMLDRLVEGNIITAPQRKALLDTGAVNVPLLSTITNLPDGVSNKVSAGDVIEARKNP